MCEQTSSTDLQIRTKTNFYEGSSVPVQIYKQQRLSEQLSLEKASLLSGSCELEQHSWNRQQSSLVQLSSPETWWANRKTFKKSTRDVVHQKFLPSCYSDLAARLSAVGTQQQSLSYCLSCTCSVYSFGWSTKLLCSQNHPRPGSTTFAFCTVSL